MESSSWHFPPPRRFWTYFGTFKAWDVLARKAYIFQFIANNPTWGSVASRGGGVSGWAVRDGTEVLRIHVCTNCPCVYRPNTQYGKYEPPRHVRFMTYIDPDAPWRYGFQRSEPAVAEVSVPDLTTAEPAAREHTTAKPPEPEPMTAEPPEPATADPIPPYSPPPLPAPHEDPPEIENGLELAALGPAPPPAPPPCVDGVLPPRQDTLFPLPAANVCKPNMAYAEPPIRELRGGGG